jgi:hypothetical protein
LYLGVSVPLTFPECLRTCKWGEPVPNFKTFYLPQPYMGKPRCPPCPPRGSAQISPTMPVSQNHLIVLVVLVVSVIRPRPGISLQAKSPNPITST